MFRRYLGITLIAGSFAVVGCSSSDDNDDPVDGMTPEEMMPEEMMPEEMMPEEMMPAGFTPPADATDGVLATVSPELFMALDAAGITALPAGNFTVFQPSADALAAAQETGGSLDPNLPEGDRAAVLQLHILEGVFAADPGDTGASAVPLGDVTTLGGAATIADGGSGIGGLTFGGANLTAVDAFATNGVVHTIDGVASAAPAVVTPPPVEGTGAFCGDPAAASSAPVAGSTYAAIVANAELDSFRALLEDPSLGLFCSNLNDPTNNWTVFAPNNTAVGGFTGTVDTTLLQGHIHTGGQLATIADLAAADATTDATGNVMLPGLLSATSARLTIDAAAGTVNTLPILDSFTSDAGAVHVIGGVINPNP